MILHRHNVVHDVYNGNKCIAYNKPQLNVSSVVLQTRDKLTVLTK